MFIKVAGDRFQAAISRMLYGSGRVLMNFRVQGKVLTLQTMGNILSETDLDILEQDSNENIDITVTVTPAITLIDKTAPVNINILPDVLNILQDNYSLSATKEWEQRYTLPTWSDDGAIEFSEKEIAAIVQNVRSLDGIVRLTKEPYANVIFYKGYVYTKYSNVLIRQKTNINADFMLSSETIRNLNRMLDVNCKMNLCLEKGYMLIKTKYKLIHVMTQHVDLSEVNAIEHVFRECRNLSVISLAGHGEKLDTLARVYKDGKVTFNILENNFSMQVTDGKNVFYYGAKGLPKVSIRVTITHVTAMNKLLGESGGLNVSVGGNVLCLSDSQEKLKLLVSGTLF